MPPPRNASKARRGPLREQHQTSSLHTALTSLLRHTALPSGAIAYHVTTQQGLIRQLRRFWSDDSPRVMVDLGCHAGHGPHRNISDATLWVEAFRSSQPGGVVIGVDAFDDFVTDLRYRFAASHAASLGIEKRAYTLVLRTPPAGAAGRDVWSVDFTWAARQHMSCCALDSGWCGAIYTRLESQQPPADHLCRVTRMRLAARGHHPAAAEEGRKPDARLRYANRAAVNASLLYDYYARLVAAGGNHSKACSARLCSPSGEPLGRYRVPRMRADALMQRELGERRIDFVKVDIDAHWRSMGLQWLIERRRFRVMSIEVDHSWGGSVDGGWNVSAADQLLWYAREHGYDGYIKVPCTHKAHCTATRPPRRGQGGAHDSLPHPTPVIDATGLHNFDLISSDLDGGWASWYLPLATAKRFQPSGFSARADGGGIFPSPTGYQTADLLLIDRTEVSLSDHLIRTSRNECMGDACQQTACALPGVARAGEARHNGRRSSSTDEALTHLVDAYAHNGESGAFSRGWLKACLECVDRSTC